MATKKDFTTIRATGLSRWSTSSSCSSSESCWCPSSWRRSSCITSWRQWKKSSRKRSSTWKSTYTTSVCYGRTRFCLSSSSTPARHRWKRASSTRLDSISKRITSIRSFHPSFKLVSWLACSIASVKHAASSLKTTMASTKQRRASWWASCRTWEVPFTGLVRLSSAQTMRSRSWSFWSQALADCTVSCPPRKVMCTKCMWWSCQSRVGTVTSRSSSRCNHPSSWRPTRRARKRTSSRSTPLVAKSWSICHSFTQTFATSSSWEPLADEPIFSKYSMRSNKLPNLKARRTCRGKPILLWQTLMASILIWLAILPQMQAQWSTWSSMRCNLQMRLWRSCSWLTSRKPSIAFIASWWSQERNSRWIHSHSDRASSPLTRAITTLARWRTRPPSGTSLRPATISWSTMYPRARTSCLLWPCRGCMEWMKSSVPVISNGISSRRTCRTGWATVLPWTKKLAIPSSTGKWRSSGTKSCRRLCSSRKNSALTASTRSRS